MSDRERLKLLNRLCKTCSRHRVIPTSMHIPDCSEGSVEVESGGFADISRGTYQGLQVAIKVVRTYVTSDLDTIRSVSILPAHYTRLDKPVAEVLPRGGRLEAPPASQHLTTAWGDVERIQVCSRFRVDGEWEHQRFHQEVSTHKSHQARMSLLGLASASLTDHSAGWCCEWLDIYA